MFPVECISGTIPNRRFGSVEVWFGAGGDPQDAADLLAAYLYDADGKKKVFDEMRTD